jgi:RNA-directed DNA polymerase
MQKTILDFSNLEARRFLLKETSYYNFDLPQYFVFQNLIDKVSQILEGKKLADFCESKPCDFENVNYKFLNNKDGKFAWRPLQLIHPAIYVSLVNRITEEANWGVIVKRFNEFSNNSKIKCLSIPLESETKQSDKATTITNWLQEIEQKSIEFALEYEYVLHSDISDCYGSIYTHSIAWALHTKEIGKQERKNKSLVGNIIDKHLQDMSLGQTNGIPQGSVLMDFIAEMVLGFADLELSKRINNSSITDYKIIRYRDDYRVFTNNPQDAELIMKFITEILIELGMKLNTQKTLISYNVVRDSIKQDKLFWLITKKKTYTLQEHLLLINELATKFTNSGSLNKALSKFFNRLKKTTETKQNIKVLISILVDIAYKNPRTYPICSAILSKFLILLNTSIERAEILELITKKFDKIPNTGHLQIWLQRITLKID